MKSVDVVELDDLFIRWYDLASFNLTKNIDKLESTVYKRKFLNTYKTV